MSEPITVDLGAVTAYADAVEQGYTGTREEFGELLANFVKRAEEVKQDKEEVKQIKETVFLKVEGFDKHVEDEKSRVTEEFNSNAEQILQTNKQEIGNAKSGALEEIANLKEDAVTQVNKTKTDGVQEITTLTNEKKSLLENTGTNQKNTITEEGTKQIQAVENKGVKTLQTIPEDYTELNNTVNNLSDLMNTKAPAIPVPSGTSGITYTDADGQAWIADEIDFGRGKYVQRVWKGVFDGSEDEVWTYNIGAHRANIILNNGNLGTYDQRGIASMCSNLLWNRNVYSDSNRENGYLINNNTFFVRVAESLALNTEPDFRTWLASNPITLQYVLATPIETDLSEAQIQAYKSLTTFKPTSIISNDAGAWMGASYVADTKLYIDNKIQEIASAIIASASEAE